MAVRPIPEGYTAVTPYLIIKGAAAAIDFYTRVFGAKELMRFDAPGHTIGHAELEIGGAIIMLADEHPESGFRGPASSGSAGVLLMLYVDDVDAVFDRAIQAGAKVHHPVKNQFYGDRSGTIVDPWGHVWTLATHVEDVSSDELQRRMQAQGA